jgi:hypothetical protein
MEIVCVTKVPTKCLHYPHIFFHCGQFDLSPNKCHYPHRNYVWVEKGPHPFQHVLLDWILKRKYEYEGV